MESLRFEEVSEIRGRFLRARDLAAGRFREAFAAQTDLPPNERWRAHLEIQAAAMLENLRSVSLPEGRHIAYFIDDRVIHPIVVPSDHPPGAHDPSSALFPFFRLDRTVSALFEYFLFISEILSSSDWRTTRILASAEEYNQALVEMSQPQLVRPLFMNYLPAGEFRDNGTAILEVTIYARAGEERIERRQLLLDPNKEFHFHSRTLLAE